MSNVFISYAKEDAAAARMLADTIQKAGFSVWWDRHIPPGKTWDDVIGRALDAAVCVIVLWSGTSVQSRWVREEAERAASRGCLIPVLVDDVEPPFGFGRIQAADLSRWAGDEHDPEYVDLLAAVTDLAKTPARESAPSKPIDKPAKSEPVHTEGRSKFVWIAAGIITVAVASYLVWPSLRLPHSEVRPKAKTAELPNVVGLPFTEAQRLLRSKGFARIVEDRIVSSTHEPGTVVEQNPIGGTLPLESSVRLVLAARPSGARPERPDGEKTRAGARPLPAPQQVGPPNGSILRNVPPSATLVWNAVPDARSYSVEHAFLEPGEDCSSLSRVGRKVADIAETTYTFRFGGTRPGCWRVWAVDERANEGLRSPWWEFGFGQPTAVLPDVVGLSVQEARQRLVSRGFTNINQDRRVSAGSAMGTVVEQQPAPGTNLRLDGPVLLVQAAEPVSRPAPPTGLKKRPATSSPALRPDQPNIEVRSVSCTRIAREQFRVEMFGSASGPAGAFLFAASSPNNGIDDSFLTTCETWSRSQPSDGPRNQKMCKRDPGEAGGTNWRSTNIYRSPTPPPEGCADLYLMPLGAEQATILSHRCEPLACR